MFSEKSDRQYEKGQRRHKDFDENGGCQRRYCNRICGGLIGSWCHLPPAKQHQLNVDPASHLPCRSRFERSPKPDLPSDTNLWFRRIRGGEEENAEL